MMVAFQKVPTMSSQSFPSFPPHPSRSRAPSSDGCGLPGGAAPDAGVIDIDLDAIRANYRMLRAEAAGAAVAGVVKADAYGLGAGKVAPALWAEGCRTFFVAHLSEALTLRRVLPLQAEIFVLNGLARGSEAACLDASVRPVLNSLDEVAAWSRAAAQAGRVLPAALQVDTGMSRLGLPDAEVAALYAEPQRLAGIDTVLVMSHLACADTPDHPANAAQLAHFRGLADRLPRARRSLANSGGVFLGSAYHFDLVRPGIALYGGLPTAGRGNPMQAVLTLRARVIQLRSVAAGAGIGYGLGTVAQRPMRLATIAAGYADGWHRCIGERGAAWLGHARLPFVGRVSMDSIVLDVSAVAADTLRAGDLLDLIGPLQTVDDVAADAGTIAYEILSALGRRFERRYATATATEYDR